MIEKALEISAEDAFAAVEYLNSQSDSIGVMDAYNRLILKLYWEKKNLPAVVLFATAGIQYGLLKARAQKSEKASELLSVANAMAYNLASFTWPGWAEADIVIGETDKSIGLRAALMNLRMADELGWDDIRHSRAHWMLGAQYLASGLHEHALDSFVKSASFARRAGIRDEELLALGFYAAVELLGEPGDEAAKVRLEEIKGELRVLERGAGFLGQIETAMVVFGA